MPSNLSFLSGACWRWRAGRGLAARPYFCIQLSNLRLHHLKPSIILLSMFPRPLKTASANSLWLPSKIRSESFTPSNCLASSALSVCSNVFFTSLILVKIASNSNPTVFTRVAHIANLDQKPWITKIRNCEERRSEAKRARRVVINGIFKCFDNKITDDMIGPYCM